MRTPFCLCVALLPIMAIGTSASAEVFPSLRKRREHHLSAAQKVASAVNTRASSSAQKAVLLDNEVGPVLPAEGKAPQVDKQDQGTTLDKPADAGADGFPQLPQVSQMLSGASGTLKSVNSQASVLEVHVATAQMQIEAKMAKQKAVFEAKLRQQEENNRLIIQANNNITSDMQSLQRGNADLKKQARDLQQGNSLMRRELRTLELRLGLAQDFTQQSHSETDDSKSALLQVLHQGLHENSQVESDSKVKQSSQDDDDDDDDDNDDDSDEKDGDKSDESASFLSVSQRVRRIPVEAKPAEAPSLDSGMGVLDTIQGGASKPEDILQSLSQEVAQLAKQEKESETTLKKFFIKDYRAGAKRKAALLAQQKRFSARRSALLDLQGELKTAQGALQTMQKHLQMRLHGLGQYIQQLANLALATPKEAPRLLKNLPKTVSLEDKRI